jgi:two-component system phosphate regulon sensor histidine kinase PhoR
MTSKSMADRPAGPGNGERLERSAALRGALVAVAVTLVGAGVGNGLDAWLLAGGLAGIALVAAFGARLRKPSVSVALYDDARQRPAVAEALLAAIPDPVILVDRRVIVVEINEAALRLLPGLKRRNPLSFALRSPDVLDGIDRVLATGALQRVEYTERVPTERAFEVQIGPIEAGAPAAETGVVLFFRDLTSSRRLERMRVDFVANASHELRTPLASLLGFIETLQGPARNDPAARERFLEIMRVQARRMTRLIDDLLSLSRIEMRAHVAPDGVVDLSAIVTQIAETLRPLAQEEGVEIRWTPPEAPVWAVGDRDELLRVAENLVENAVKYGGSGGRVDVDLARLGGEAGQRERVALSVRDHGPGIAPEHLPRLTERFYRADAAESREKGGTGLGLAIVKHIVNRHRGQLAIESEKGAGALFTVTLPAPRSAPSEKA